MLRVKNKCVCDSHDAALLPGLSPGGRLLCLHQPHPVRPPQLQHPGGGHTPAGEAQTAASPPVEVTTSAVGENWDWPSLDFYCVCLGITGDRITFLLSKCKTRCLNVVFWTEFSLLSPCLVDRFSQSLWVVSLMLQPLWFSVLLYYNCSGEHFIAIFSVLR